ncbi:MAG: Uma2 family endonuclease [Chloroflexota bacterium]
MVTHRSPTITDWLANIPSDTEEAPWMSMPDYQLWAIHLLLSILRRYRGLQGLRWYIGAELWVTLPRPGLPDLSVSPDLFMAEADSRGRTSWNIQEERQPPRFVLEIVTEASWARDTEEKRVVYDFLGVEEYAIFAPLRDDGGPKLFGYHRGPFGPWQPWQPEGGALRSRALGGLTLEVWAADDRFLRLRDTSGQLLPSPEEAEAESARAEARMARAKARMARQAEAARAAEAEMARQAEAARAAEAEMARRLEVAEARAALLEAELTHLREDH